jgi:hypothetical protein
VNLNGKQVIAIIVAVLGVVMGSAAQLTDLFGAGNTKIIISVAGLLNSTLSAVLAIIMTQTAQVKDVLAMPGVERLDVNAKASPALAALAVDPAVNKIAPIPAAIDQVTKTAQGS